MNTEPQQKATELVEYYFRLSQGTNYKEKLLNARSCAIKTVNEVMEALPGMVIRNREWIDNPDLKHWDQVRDLLSQMK